MASPTLENLEERVTALEKTLQELLHPQQRPRFKDWRQAVGLFRGNDCMQQIDEAGRELREADRRESGA